MARFRGLDRITSGWTFSAASAFRCPSVPGSQPEYAESVFVEAIPESELSKPRSELTKKLWDYIKKNGCQDKKKRTMINADDSLKPVFNGKSQVSMFEMTKLVSGHIK